MQESSLPRRGQRVLAAADPQSVHQSQREYKGWKWNRILVHHHLGLRCYIQRQYPEAAFHRRQHQPANFTDHLGVFGGSISFGFLGLFIGPTVLAIAYAVLAVWRGRSVQS
jgi:hypothetical protein